MRRMYDIAYYARETICEAGAELVHGCFAVHWRTGANRIRIDHPFLLRTARTECQHDELVPGLSDSEVSCIRRFESQVLRSVK